MDNTACARSRHLLLTALATSVLAVTAVQAQPLYALTDLGPVWQGGRIAINDSGQATGTWLPDGTDHRAFLYSGGTRIDLGVLPGMARSLGTGINRHGHVTGSLAAPRGTAPSFVYTSATGMQGIPVGGGVTRAFAWGINDAGQVTGAGSFADRSVGAFIYSPSTGMQGLGTLGGQDSNAWAVNNKGHVTGRSENSALAPEAFVWSPATGMVGLGGPTAEGFAINDAGQVAGSTGRNAFLYTRGSGVQDLGVLRGGLSSGAFGINEAGNVVGHSSFSALSSPEAFVYSAQAGMLSLQSLLDPASGRGWSLEIAYDINNKGQIAGIGLFDGKARAFLLTQCRAPSGVLAKLGLR